MCPRERLSLPLGAGEVGLDKYKNEALGEESFFKLNLGVRGSYRPQSLNSQFLLKVS